MNRHLLSDFDTRKLAGDIFRESGENNNFGINSPKMSFIEVKCAIYRLILKGRIDTFKVLICRLKL